MFPTLEVRWFYRGAVPPEVDAWFQRGPGKVERHPSREDHYLRITDTDALGIKLREGRVEVKQRAHEHGTLRFHERVSGAVEHWRKWSFQLAAARSALSSIAVPPTPWIAVRKRRLLRTYRLTTDKCVVPVSTPQNIGQACELVLTSVRVVGQDWWTLAFEAFGDESALKEQLVLVARHVFAVDEAPSFHAPESCGYADWLRRITQKEEAK